MDGSTTLRQVALGYRDGLRGAISELGVGTVAATDVEADGSTVWPALLLSSPAWRTTVTVVPTSDGVVLDLRRGSDASPRALCTWGRPPAAVTLELLMRAAPTLPQEV